MLAQTQQGQLDVSWLDLPRNPHRQAAYPDAHKIRKLSVVNQSDHSLSHSADGYQSMGHIFPAQVCFDYQRLSDFLLSFK